MYKEKVCSVGMTLRLFWWHSWITFFLATSKLLTSMASEVIRGHLRPLNHKLLFVILLRSIDKEKVWYRDFFGWYDWDAHFSVTSKLLTSMTSEVVWGHLRPFCQKLLFDIFKRSRLHFDWFYGHWLLNGLRGWPCTKRRSAPWVWLWDFFGWYNWDAHFSATSKLLTSMTSEVVWGHLRPFCQKLLFDIF